MSQDKRIHYLESQEEKRRRLNSSANFTPSALCGNGAFYKHLRTTDHISRVTCEECKKAWNRPGYSGLPKPIDPT